MKKRKNQRKGKNERTKITKREDLEGVKHIKVEGYNDEIDDYAMVDSSSSSLNAITLTMSAFKLKNKSEDNVVSVKRQGNAEVFDVYFNEERMESSKDYRFADFIEEFNVYKVEDEKIKDQISRGYDYNMGMDVATVDE